MEIANIYGQVLDELKKILSAETVIGEPLTVEDKILIPVIKVGFGGGAGSGRGRGKERSEGFGAGGGIGGGIIPVALIVIFKGIEGPEGIKVLSLQEPSKIGKVLAKVAPVILERFLGEREVEEEE